MSNTPNPNQVRVRHATAVAERKLAIDALKLRSVRTASVLAYSVGPDESDEGSED